MDRLPLSANKTNLLRLREELGFAIEGLSLLDEKKEALMSVIQSLSTKLDRVRSEVNQLLQESYRKHQDALLTSGRLVCERAAVATRAAEDILIVEKTFMGVPLPILRIHVPPICPAYGFLDTGWGMDEAVKAVHHSLDRIVELAEIEVGFFRLMWEIKKTLKRVHALEHIHIPSYRATIKHIEESLEEKEREFLFQLKQRKRLREETGHDAFSPNSGSG